MIHYEAFTEYYTAVKTRLIKLSNLENYSRYK